MKPEPKMLSIDAAAALLKCRPIDVRRELANGTMWCSILRRRWYGMSLQTTLDGDRAQDGADYLHTNVNALDKRLGTYSVKDAQTGKFVAVEMALITSNYWYLNPGDLITTAESAQPVAVNSLFPRDAAALHASDPRHYPWPHFAFMLNREQRRSSRVVPWDELRIPITCIGALQGWVTPMVELADAARAREGEAGHDESEERVSRYPAVFSSTIKARFRVTEASSPEVNDEWWSERLTHADDYKIAEYRVGQGRRGRQSAWRADLLAVWLEDGGHMARNAIRVALREIPGYEERTDELFPDGD